MVPANVVELGHFVFALLHLFRFLKPKIFLQHADQFLAIEYLELCDGVFINGVDKKQGLRRSSGTLVRSVSK
jgi:hypothetical protein